MAIVFHEFEEAPHRNARAGTVVVDRAKCPGLEMGPVGVRMKFRAPLSRNELGECRRHQAYNWETYTANAEIVSPDLASGGRLQKPRFERGFAIDA